MHPASGQLPRLARTARRVQVQEEEKKEEAVRTAAAGDEPSEAPPAAADTSAPSPPAAAPKPAASAAERAGGKPEAVLACGRRGGHLATAIARGGLSALEAALATAPREVREGGVGAEAQARCDRLLVY